MAHSIELLLDDHSERLIRTQWQALADAGLPSQLRVTSPTNRPHLTLLAARQISPAVDDVLGGLAGRLPLGCVVGAPLVFGDTTMTLARLIVPSAELLEFHAEVYRLSLAHLSGDPFAHCAPGHWTAHVTLGRRLADEEVGRALTVLRGSGDLPVRFVGLRRWDGDRRVDHLLIG